MQLKDFSSWKTLAPSLLRYLTLSSFQDREREREREEKGAGNESKLWWDERERESGKRGWK